MSEQPKRRRKRQPEPPRRLEEWRIKGLDHVFPGFAAWYLANYDEHGVMIPSATLPELKRMFDKEEQ